MPTAAAANLPTRGMDKLCYVCLINYLSHRDVDQSIDSFFIMDNGSLSPSILYSVVKSHHKFMLASYMKQIAKFVALLHQNASFFNFCIII